MNGCLLWWIMIIRHKIWYVNINIYMRINMLHILFINFPFAHRVTEFLISPRHRSARTITHSLLMMITNLLRTRSSVICSRSWGRYITWRTPTLGKRIKDKDAVEIVTADTTRRETYRQQGGGDRKTQSRDHNDESHQYANTATASGRKSRKSELSSTSMDPVTIVMERILIIML